MGSFVYEVHYGVPFNMNKAIFTTEQAARKFIADHVFGDERYCMLQKIEILDADFTYVGYWDAPTKEVSDKLFNRGIATTEEYNKEGM